MVPRWICLVGMKEVINKTLRSTEIDTNIASLSIKFDTSGEVLRYIPASAPQLSISKCNSFSSVTPNQNQNIPLNHIPTEKITYERFKNFLILCTVLEKIGSQ